MPKHASIAIIHDDWSTDAIYNHWDGNLSGLGMKLVKYYIDKNSVQELINLGNVSYVGLELKPNTPTRSFDKPERGITVAYGRDRGDTNQQAIHFDNFKDYCKSTMIQEYNYVFYLGHWYIYKMNCGKLPTSLNDFVNLSILM